MCVFSYPHLYRRHSAAPMTPASLFVLQFSLIFSLCGGHAHFTVVTDTLTCAVTLGLKVICTHFHIHTGAGRHVLNLLCARSRPLPLCHRNHLLHGKAHVSSFTYSQTELLSVDLIMKASLLSSLTYSMICTLTSTDR